MDNLINLFTLSEAFICLVGFGIALILAIKEIGGEE